MSFINATLSKNQLYKHKKQINKVPTISKQDDMGLFHKYICTPFYCPTIYFRVIIMVDCDLTVPGGHVEE